MLHLRSDGRRTTGAVWILGKPPIDGTPWRGRPCRAGGARLHDTGPARRICERSPPDRCHPRGFPAHRRCGRSRHLHPSLRPRRSPGRGRSPGAAGIPERPLGGLPFAVKDNIDVAGSPTTAACPAYAYEPGTGRLCHRAGCVRPGRSRSARQISTSSPPNSSVCGPPGRSRATPSTPGWCRAARPRGRPSPWPAASCPSRSGPTPPGRAGVPAALNNIVGLKPTLGALSTRGVVPACRTLDVVSIFALTVEDAHDVFRSAAGFDADEPYSRAVSVCPAGCRPAAPAHRRPEPPDPAVLRQRGPGRRLRRHLRRAHRRRRAPRRRRLRALPRRR